MRILVSGSHGLVGTRLVQSLESDGHTVIRLVRSGAPAADQIQWDPERGQLEADTVAKFAPEAVVHLAGENIAAERWSTASKERIRTSRVQGTRLIADVLVSIPNPPRVFVAASAIGYYGDRQDEVLTEDSRPGTGFLAEVTRQWESATVPAAEFGIRVVNTRIGIVLDSKGGALPRLQAPFRFGVGGPLANGKQWMSWITLQDVVAALRHSLECTALHGPVNLVAPNAVRNSEFARTLGKVMGRPALLPAPAFALRAIMGTEMANALLLASQRVEPKRLAKTGFQFSHPELEPALRHLLGH